MWAPEPAFVERESHPSQRFSLHFTPQREWHLWHALWFWAMGIGSGVFLLRQFFALEQTGTLLGMDWPDILGIVFVAIGGLILILDLGKPQRVFNALLQPKHSWISRGAIADFTFLFFGALYTLAGWFSLPWSPATFVHADLVSQIFIAICTLTAFVIMLYPGFVLYESLAIPFWNSVLVPALFFELAITSGFGLLLVTMAATGTLTAAVLTPLATATLIANVVTLLTVVLYLFDRYKSPRPAARVGLQRLLTGKIAPFFWATAVLGLIAPVVLTALALAGVATVPLLVAGGVLAILGSFGFRYVQLLSGVRQTAVL
ncbi:MAG: polysulfide reductase NrfD [Firmicutes bacterium]|nr:polysulfide reductase NrfD [Bacillota bacterium]